MAGINACHLRPGFAAQATIQAQLPPPWEDRFTFARMQETV